MNEPKECAVKFCPICDKYVPESHEHKIIAGQGGHRKKIRELLSFAATINVMGNYNENDNDN